MSAKQSWLLISHGIRDSDQFGWVSKPTNAWHAAHCEMNANAGQLESTVTSNLDRILNVCPGELRRPHPTELL